MLAPVEKLMNHKSILILTLLEHGTKHPVDLSAMGQDRRTSPQSGFTSRLDERPALIDQRTEVN